MAVSARARSAARLAVYASSIPTRYSATDTEAMASSSSSSDERSMISAFVGDQDVGVEDQAPAHGSSTSRVKTGPRLLLCSGRIHRLAGHVGQRRAQVGAGAAVGQGVPATGWLPRTMVIVSPRSTASSRSEKCCRDASVAIIVFVSSFLSDNQIRAYGLRRMTMRTGRCRLSRGSAREACPDVVLVSQCGSG